MRASCGARWWLERTCGGAGAKTLAGRTIDAIATAANRLTGTAPGRTRIARPALSQRIGRALDAGSVLLVAEAGFGKTMALEEALEGGWGASAWLPCSEAERDPVQLLAGVIGALERAVPGLADAHAGQLETGDPRASARRLRTDLERVLVDPLTLVLDDAEHLADAPGACAVVSELLGAREGALRVAIASRRPLPLRLAKLRATGRLSELGPGDLALSVAECAELLRVRRGRDPADAEVEAVMAATGGWPLGVTLAALGDAGYGPASREAAFEFMGEEVLERLDRGLRATLLDSSIPRELDRELAAALGLGEGSLERIEAVGLFLRPLDPERTRFRYHPLFREFLLRRLRAERPPERRRQLHAAAAAALEQSGRVPDAVENWLEADAWDEAIAAMTRTRQAGLAPVRASPETVTAWIERLPEDQRGRSAVMSLQGSIDWSRCRYESAARPLRAALEGYEREGDREREWLVRFLLADSLFELGRFEECIEVGGAERDGSGPEEFHVPDARFMAATAIAALGRLDEAQALWDRLDRETTKDPLAPLRGAFRGMFVDLPAGRSGEALERIRSVAALLDPTDPVQLSAYARSFAARVLEEQGNDAEALDEALAAAGAARRGGAGGHLEPYLQLQRPGAWLRAGRIEEAEAELERAAALRAEGWRSYDLELTRASVAAARGDAPGAVSAAERSLAIARSAPVMERIRAAALLAPVLAEAGQPADALAAVEDALAAADGGPFSRARLLAVRAWLHQRSGGAKAALDDACAALDEAGDEAPHLVRREWDRLESLLWAALEQGRLEPDHVVRTIERARPGGADLLPFTAHPLPEMRRAAVGPTAASGHPRAFARIEELMDDADPGVAAAARAARESALRSPPALVIHLLGGFRVLRGAWEIDPAAWGRPMAARFTRFMLCQGGSATPEDVLFEAFWPELSIESARRSLHVVVTRARAVLDPPGAERSAIEISDRTYRLQLRDGDVVDVREFEAAAAAALAEHGPSRRRLLERARALWGGEPLPEDRYAGWSAAWREGLVDRYAEVVEALAEECARGGDHAASIDCARTLVELDPLNEGAHRALMTAYARAGRTASALRQFLSCRRVLVDELGVEPAGATTELQQRILAGEAV